MHTSQLPRRGASESSEGSESSLSSLDDSSHGVEIDYRSAAQIYHRFHASATIHTSINARNGSTLFQRASEHQFVSRFHLELGDGRDLGNSQDLLEHEYFTDSTAPMEPEIALTAPTSHIQTETPIVPAMNAQTPQIVRQLHRVQIIRCRHCDTFLTDRGMRAVLLLKPSFTLYSTDAQPLNAGPLFHSDSEYARIATAERTCECLTQAIGCYGCGWAIGYHIVSPCRKCTRSVSKHEGTANGHRFVFHYGEVVSHDRHYIPGELGIKPQREVLPAFKVVSPPRVVPTLSEMDSNAQTVQFNPQARRQSVKEPQPPQVKELHVEARFLPALNAGDVVYWHHLRNSGERARPVDPATIRRQRPLCER